MRWRQVGVHRLEKGQDAWSELHQERAAQCQTEKWRSFRFLFLLCTSERVSGLCLPSQQQRKKVRKTQKKLANFRPKAKIPSPSAQRGG